VRQIEQIAIRQQKLRETKQNSDELMSFLGFSDVEDFNCVAEDAFIHYTSFGESGQNLVATNTLPQNLDNALATSSEKSPFKNRCLKVGDKRNFLQREVTCEEVGSPLPRNLHFS
jgi:hypothetical protein